MEFLGPYESDGPLPESDHCGYEAAFETLHHCQQSGSDSNSNTEFESTWKLRTTFSSHCRASWKANHSSMALGCQEGNIFALPLTPVLHFGSIVFWRELKQEWVKIGAPTRPFLLMSCRSCWNLQTLPKKKGWLVFHVPLLLCSTRFCWESAKASCWIWLAWMKVQGQRRQIHHHCPPGKDQRRVGCQGPSTSLHPHYFIRHQCAGLGYQAHQL